VRGGKSAYQARLRGESILQNAIDAAAAERAGRLAAAAARRGGGGTTEPGRPAPDASR
jgi:predicted nucleic acid-binding protein